MRPHLCAPPPNHTFTRSIHNVETFEITGGSRLAGDVTVTGAKNSVLKVMAAALLAEGTTALSHVPDIVDVPIMSDILRGLGAEVTGHAPEIAITVPASIGHEAAYEHVRRIRGSQRSLSSLCSPVAPGRIGPARRRRKGVSAE